MLSSAVKNGQIFIVNFKSLYIKPMRSRSLLTFPLIKEIKHRSLTRILKPQTNQIGFFQLLTPISTIIAHDIFHIKKLNLKSIRFQFYDFYIRIRHFYCQSLIIEIKGSFEFFQKWLSNYQHTARIKF